jgi:hypothetical protein
MANVVQESGIIDPTLFYVETLKASRSLVENDERKNGNFFKE